MCKQTGKALAWIVMGVFVFVAAYAVRQAASEQKGPLAGSKRPVITGYYSPEKGRYGEVLKIYIAAEDADGDMQKIATQVTQPGFGTYSPSWLNLKGERRQRFIGYLQWNTFSSKGKDLSDGSRISIDISLFDSAGNESNRIVIPYEFVSGAPSPPSPPAPFDQPGISRLGYISIDLQDPTKQEGFF